MTTKSNKSESKLASKGLSRRTSIEVEKKIKKLLSLANNKKSGRKVKYDHLINIALDLITPEHIKKLQEQTLTNEDRKELLRQKYISIHGVISKDEFTGFMLKPEYFEFLKTHENVTAFANAG